jgi:hypothetical protein
MDQVACAEAYRLLLIASLSFSFRIFSSRIFMRDLEIMRIVNQNEDDLGPTSSFVQHLWP